MPYPTTLPLEEYTHNPMNIHSGKTIERYRLICACWLWDLTVMECLGKCLQYGYVTTTRHIEGVYLMEEAAKKYKAEEEKANNKTGYLFEPETGKDRHYD